MKPATERALSTLRSSLIAAGVACFLNPVSAAASLPSDPAPSGRMSSSEGNQVEAAIP